MVIVLIIYGLDQFMCAVSDISIRDIVSLMMAIARVAEYSYDI